MEFKLFKKEVNEHKEALERELKANEEYLETMVAGTEEYKLTYEAVRQQREELKTYEKPKIGFKEVIEILTVVGTFAGVGATIVTSLHRDNTKVKLAKEVVYNEDVENILANGTAKSIMTKD